VRWSKEAKAQLKAIAQRAPRQAGGLYDAVYALARQPFPGMYREIEGRPGEHVLTVSPLFAVYMVTARRLTVLSVEDARQQQEPW
jgi:hypothetical protein